MNQAEKDAEQWYRTHAHRQERLRIQAKEMGYEHYTDQYGYTIIKQPEKQTLMVKDQEKD